MKVGDLVQWLGSGTAADYPPDRGIVVDGPREGTRGDEPAISYEVVWFDCKETMWHNDYNLELISENR